MGTLHRPGKRSGYGTLSEHDIQFHYPIPTLWIIILQQILLITYLVFVFVTFGHENGEGPLTAFGFRALMHVFIWAILLGLNRYMHYFHRKARQRGYLKFYRITKSLIRWPVIVWALGNAALVAVMALWKESHEADKFIVLKVLVCFELFVELICAAIYTKMVYSHNKYRVEPDAQMELLQADYKSPIPSRPPSSLPDLALEYGISDESREVVERQAEMIRFLQDQRNEMSKQIAKLKETLELFSKTKDPERVLESKEQEVQTLLEELALQVETLKAEHKKTVEVNVMKASNLKEQNMSLEDMLEREKEEHGKTKLLLEMEKESSTQAKELIQKLQRELQAVQMELDRPSFKDEF